MGLDMYLMDDAGNEIAYWRKANQIHKWFVDNVQNGVDDCGKYEVSTEQLQKLYDVVNEVTYENEKALSLLPPQTGFFFGTYTLDDWYFSNLEHTRQVLKDILKGDKTPPSKIYYQSSW